MRPAARHGAIVAVVLFAVVFHAAVFWPVVHRLSWPVVGLLALGAVGVKVVWGHARR